MSAGIVSGPDEYRLSSCQDYFNEKYLQTGLTHTRLILSIFSDDKQQTAKMFKAHHREINKEVCLDDNKVKKRKSDEEVREEIKKLLKDKPVTVLQQMERAERDEILRKIKGIQGGSLRQIARITGLGLYVIHQALFKVKN